MTKKAGILLVAHPRIDQHQPVAIGNEQTA